MKALIDCNNFFVSCEKVFRPDIKDKPVVVLSSNDGCIVAMSNEVKALGIARGAPYFQIKKELDSLNCIIFSSNHTLYQSLSNRIMRLLEELCPEVDVYSIDEAFLNLSGIEDPEEFCLRIKKQVEQGVGIPIAVGIARSNTLAKAALEFAKKPSLIPAHIPVPSTQCFFLEQSIESDMLKALPIEDVWGIGKKTSKIMRANRIYTAKDLRDSNEIQVRHKYSLGSWKVQQALKGISQLGFMEDAPIRKGIMSSCSFSRPVTKKGELYRSLASYTNSAIYRLHKQEAQAQNFSFYIKSKTHDSSYNVLYQTFSRSYSLALASAYLPDFLPLIRRGLNEIFKEGYSYAKAGVSFGGIEFVGRGSQIDLFAPYDEKKENLIALQKDLQQKFGRKSFAVLSAMGKRDWDMKRNHLSPYYTTRWEDLPTVNNHL